MTSDNISGLGVILGSAQTDPLIAWYRAVLEPLGAKWHQHMLTIGPTIIGFDERDDVAEKSTEPGRQMINIMVKDIRAAEAHLNTLDVNWVRPVEDVGDGWYFSTVTDPDGNYVQFLQGPVTA
ncbi:VOC family protein [Streptomyces triticagri]|nr:VOC family protein [Streptomyces triticagri]